MLHLSLLALAFILVILNGFFVAAEFALVKVRHTRVQTLQKNSGIKGRILAKVHGHLDAYLSACQLGITLTSLALGWIGEPAVAHILEPLLVYVGVVSPEATAVIAFTIAFSLISFLHIVVGELMPKSMAIRQSERISLWTAMPLYVFYWLMYPAIWILNVSASALLKLCRLNASHHADQAYSSDEFKVILQMSHLHGEFTKTEADMIEQTLEFSDLQVSDVMRPVDELIALDNQDSLMNNIALMVQHHYSRYPVYLGNVHNMLGVVHAKDVLAAWQSQQLGSDLNPLLRPILRMSPQDSTIELLQRFREGTSHLALVYKKEVLVGFVTLDNVLQVIIGRIKDEFHRTKQDWVKLDDGCFEVKGHASIYVLEQLLDIDLSSYPVTTVSGLIFHVLERYPTVGEYIQYTHFTLQVLAVEGAKINRVKVMPHLHKNCTVRA